MSFRLRHHELLEDASDPLIERTAERTMPIYQWAPDALIVPRGGGTIRWDPDWAPYFHDALDIVRARITGTPTVPGGDDHQVEQLTLITSAQIAKTFGYLTPALAWIACCYPRDIALVMPSDTSLKEFVRDKLRKTFDDSPRLARMLPLGVANQERRLGIHAWRLDDLTVHFLNGNVALQLRSRDLPIIFCDEFGSLNPDCQGQGSPLDLMRERQKTYPHDRFWTGISTPLRIGDIAWSRLCETTHERLFLACLNCGAHDWFQPDRIEATALGLSSDEIYSKDAAAWRCKACSHRHSSDDRNKMVSAACASRVVTEAGGWIPGDYAVSIDGVGTWTPRATFHENGRLKTWLTPSGIRRGKWLNAAYSRLVTFGYFLSDAMNAENGKAENRQSHTNNMRAEPWNPRPDAASQADIARVQILDDSTYQRGQLPKTVPAGGRILLSADQQGNHQDTSSFPWVARYWHPSGDSWKIDAGEVTKEEGWAGLDLLEKRTWPVGSEVLGVKASIIDTANGNMIRWIRTWCNRHPTRRYAFAGSGTMNPDTPYFEQKSNPKNAYKMFGLQVAYYYNSNMFRDELFDAIRGMPGSHPWHLPGNAEEFYLKSLTSEMRVPQTQLIRGRLINRLIWVPRTYLDAKGQVKERRDNHWWDCEVMQFAGVFILGWVKLRPRSGGGAAAGGSENAGANWMSGYSA